MSSFSRAQEIRNVGPYQIPQYVSEDRRRARDATLRKRRKDYQLAYDPGLDGRPSAQLPPYLAPWQGAPPLRELMTRVVASLPPKGVFLTELPPEARWDGAKAFRHGTHAGSILLRQMYLRLTNFDYWPCSEAAYGRLLGTIPPPRARDRWREDIEFARQRLCGVNPMAIRRCVGIENAALRRAADLALQERHKTNLQKAMDRGTVYMSDFPLLWDRSVQGEVRKGASLAAPTCLFHVADGGDLLPIAIQLKPQDVVSDNPVFTPLDGIGDWMLARAHAQAADAHYHEAIYHLMETHLVAETLAIHTRRELHPDHPLHQLLAPHFEYTFGINEQARKNMLADFGEIAASMAARNTGAMNVARLFNQTWSWKDRALHRELELRDVDDLPRYLYRDDARAVWDAMHGYARGIVELWYADDADVREDTELQAWADAIGDPQHGRIRDFPRTLETRDELITVITDIVFRVSAQHAAVNNGQFGAYGWVPNVPGTVHGDLPHEATPGQAPGITEREFFRRLPNRTVTLGQLGMAWLLSEPTERSLLRAGESPAFRPDRCYRASEVVGRFRQRLRSVSDAIGHRNDEIGIEYNYLKPQNIDRSIAI